MNAELLSRSDPEFIRYAYHKNLTYEELSTQISQLGHPRRFYFQSGKVSILNNLRILASKYIAGSSLSEVIDYGRSLGILCNKSTLNYVFSIIGILRTKGEAQSLAIELGKITIPQSNRYIYNLGGSVVSLRSSYELKYVQLLNNNQNVVSIEYEPIRIKYKDPQGNTKVYIPDFKVTYTDHIELIEIKPKFRTTDEVVRSKSSYALEYCKSVGWDYRIITEDDLFASGDIDYLDPNIINSNIKSSEELIEWRKSIGVKNPYYASDFISKLRSGTYKYKDHPRTNIDITYDSIMDHINTRPPFTCKIEDIYSLVKSRNVLIARLRDEAPGKESNIYYWMAKYLDVLSMTSYHVPLLRAMWEVQQEGLRDYGLKTKDQLIEELIPRAPISPAQVHECVGWSQNRTRRYLQIILNTSDHEIVKEVNSKIIQSSKSV